MRRILVVALLVVVVLSSTPLTADVGLEDTTSVRSGDFSTGDGVRPGEFVAGDGVRSSAFPADDSARERATPVPSVNQRVPVVLELRRNASVPESSALEVDRVGSERDSRVAYGSAPLSEAGSISDVPGVESVRFRNTSATGPDDTASAAPSDDDWSLGLPAGVSGRNVTVGIIDSDFRLSHPALAGHLGAYRSFGDTGHRSHGTAVASVVTRVAPEATLHLAAVGDRVSPGEYGDAVRWLREGGADVVVDAGSYYAQADDGPLAGTAARAARDVVFVTSAGNHAGRVWQGNHSGGGWVEFAPGVDGNRIDVDGYSGRIEATLRWSSSANDTAVDFDLFLFREQPGRDAVVDSATRPDREHARVDVVVPKGRYYLAVSGDAPDSSTARVSLTANEPLEYTTTARPGVPGTVPEVLAVGASSDGIVRPFSPTGVDLVAPDTLTARSLDESGGTSFAAPYVAGTAALVLSTDDSLTPNATRSLLLSSADDSRLPSDDFRTGEGLANATAAVRLALDSADATTAAGRESGTGGSDVRVVVDGGNATVSGESTNATNATAGANATTDANATDEPNATDTTDANVTNTTNATADANAAANATTAGANATETTGHESGTGGSDVRVVVDGGNATVIRRGANATSVTTDAADATGDSRDGRGDGRDLERRSARAVSSPDSSAPVRVVETR